MCVCNRGANVDNFADVVNRSLIRPVQTGLISFHGVSFFVSVFFSELQHPNCYGWTVLALATINICLQMWHVHRIYIYIFFFAFQKKSAKDWALLGSVG